jgi:hypothetical protein
VVDVSRDQLSQNETPIAINPANPANMITGANDWNYNDGCAVNATSDGGRTWTPTLPDGFLPGVTKFTNDPFVAGTGAYDAGGDPTIAFSPDGKVAYYVCQAFDFTSPYDIALLLNRSTDGGFTWQKTNLVQISTFNGNGTTTGSNGKFADHENIHVDPVNGNVYVTWAEFSGVQGTHSPVYVAVSHDQGATWLLNKVTVGNVKNNQDQRVVTDAWGNAYLVFDNGVNGGKGLTVLYASKSTDGGVSWSAPVQFATLTNPVCVFPPGCFNISGGQFRAGGTYPAPAFDVAHNRLDVLIADIRGTYAQMYLYSLKPDLTLDFTTQLPAAAGDQRPARRLVLGPELLAEHARRSHLRDERRRRAHVADCPRDAVRLRPVAVGRPAGNGLPTVHRRLQRHRVDEHVRGDDVDGDRAAAAVQPRDRLREGDAVGELQRGRARTPAPSPARQRRAP